MTRRKIAEARPVSTSRADDCAGVTEPRNKAGMCAQVEAHFTALIESTEDLIWSVDLDHRLIAFNRAFRHSIETTYGVPVAVGKRIEDLITLERPMLLPSFYERVLEEGPFRVEYPLSDGRPLELAFNPIVIEGKTTGISVFGKDITKRKMAEMKLRNSEERYRATFEQAAVGIVHASLEGRYLTCNPRFAEIVGYPIEEIPSLTFQQITAPEDQASTDAMIAQLVNGAVGSVTWEKRYLRKDGSLTWARATVSMHRDAEGRPLHYIALVEDISARKEAEERLDRAADALRNSEERYRTAFQMSLDAINISRIIDGRFIDCNQTFLDMSGYMREEIIGRTSLELGIWADASDRQAMMNMLRLNSRVCGMEVQMRRKGGEIGWGHLSASIIELDGVSCILTVVRDITETKAAAERLAAAQKALRDSEVRYRTAFQTSPDLVDINRLDDGICIDANDAYLDILGYKRKEVIGRTPLELDIWADPGERQNYVKILRQNSICRNLEARFRKKDGTILWGLLSASAIELDGVPCVLSVMRDVSEAKEAEERLAAAQKALRDSEVRYRIAFHASPNAVNIFRLDDGKYLDANPAFLEAMGLECQEVIGRTALELNTWADPRELQDIFESLKRNNIFRGEVKLRKKSGETFWGLMSASVFEHDGISCVLSVMQDLSDVKAAQDEINKLAFYDPLTHLPNRRLLMDRLLRSPLAASRTRRKRALLFVDLDNFKSLNDALGHQTGDLLLQEVALRLDSCVRDTDTVARCGGDEFAVMLENLSEVAENAAAQAQIIGEKILAICDQPYLLAGHECHCPSSIGITVFGEELESANDALQRAEIAMFQAKEAGRNTIRFFAPALQAAVNARAAMEEDLRQAIKANQFVLYYQPQVEQGRLISAETLLRWKHPRHGILGPGEFIPLAEETGLILPLGDWVLEAACTQVAAWAVRKESAAITLAVNISARQFRQPDFVERVLAALKRTGANPQSLKLELTESMLLDNVDDVIAKMTTLKSHGLRFSLDDFGTGYSSLAYLRRLPLDELKIDLIFVRDLVTDAASGAIAHAILSLGKAMGLRVIAEGVETEEQRDFLVRMGCHSFQGFLYSRPLPLEEFQLWLPDSAESAARISRKPRRSSAL